MADTTQKFIDNLIAAIWNAEAPESVTNEMVARVLDFLNTGYQNLLTGSSAIVTETAERRAADAALQQTIDSLYEALQTVSYTAEKAEVDAESNRNAIDRILGENASQAIENFNEIIDFLEGVKDSDSLVNLFDEIRQRLDGIAVEQTTLGTLIQGKADVSSVTRVDNRVKGVGICPFDGFHDPTSVETPTEGVWWLLRPAFMPEAGGRFLFCSSAYGLTDRDYNRRSLAGPDSGRTDRIYRCGSALYRVVDGELVSEVELLSADVNTMKLTKQNSLKVSEDLFIGKGDILSLTDMAKKRLFIDQWNVACGKFGTYNYETGFFELNGLTDLTYEEAIDIYALRSMCESVIDSENKFCGLKVRTLLPITLPSMGYQLSWKSAFATSKSLEVITFRDGVINDTPLMFNECSNLKKINGVIRIMSANNSSMFAACKNLEYFRLIYLVSSIGLASSPKVSYDSFKFLIDYANNGKNAITITLHPDVYAKITDEDNPDYEQWHPLLALAADKNISLATV